MFVILAKLLPVNVKIEDTFCTEDKKALRQFQYLDARFVIICVATDEKSSLASAPKWCAEIREVEPDMPIMIFRTMIDLESLIENPVTHDEVVTVCQSLNLQSSYSTSARKW